MRCTHDFYEPSNVLRGIILLWQTSSKIRQSIIETKEIPMVYKSECIVDRMCGVSFELEESDLKDLFLVFQQNKRIGCPPGTSEEEITRGLAELKVIYRLLKAKVAALE